MYISDTFCITDFMFRFRFRPKLHYNFRPRFGFGRIYKNQFWSVSMTNRLYSICITQKILFCCVLCLCEGDMIELRTRTDTQHDWWEGTGRDGRLGIFPANYVKLLWTPAVYCYYCCVVSWCDFRKFITICFWWKISTNIIILPELFRPKYLKHLSSQLSILPVHLLLLKTFVALNGLLCRVLASWWVGSWPSCPPPFPQGSIKAPVSGHK